MARRQALALVPLALALLTGCSGEEAREPAAVPSNSAAEAPAATTTTLTERSAQRSSRAPRPLRTRGARPRVTTLAGGLDVPWDIGFLPDGRALVTERPGRVRLVDTRGRLRSARWPRVPTQARGEGGLLGLAVDPAFRSGRRFVYLYVTTASGMEVQRWRWTGGRLRRDGVVLDGIVAGSIHDSGRLRFGPDERLYVATGDAGRGGAGPAARLPERQDPPARAPRVPRRATNDPEILSRRPSQPPGPRLAAPHRAPVGHRARPERLRRAERRRRGQRDPAWRATTAGRAPAAPPTAGSRRPCRSGARPWRPRAWPS